MRQVGDKQQNAFCPASIVLFNVSVILPNIIFVESPVDVKMDLNQNNKPAKARIITIMDNIKI